VADQVLKMAALHIDPEDLKKKVEQEAKLAKEEK
jgi:hypothetical protein